MKKIFLTLLICFCFMFAGCSTSGGISMVLNSNGEITEKYYIPFPKDQIVLLTGDNILAEQKVQNLMSNIQKDCNNEIFNPMLSTYKQKINSNSEYSKEKKTELIAGVTITNNLPSENVFILGEITSVEYRINYKNIECYNLFKSINELINEEKVIEETVSFLTTTTKVTKDPLFDKIVYDSVTIGKNAVSLVEDEMITVYGETVWNYLKQELNFNKYSEYFTFTYIVPTARIHSNAKRITNHNGYYSHEWEIPIENIDEDGNSIVKIEYWQITANKWIWYFIAITGALVIATATGICYKVKQKQIIKKDEQASNTFKTEE